MNIEVLLLLLSLGSIGGFLSGLLGIGGGIIFVPAIYFILKNFGIGEEYIMHIAIATSLAVVLATGFTSAYHHNKKASVDLTIIKRWAPFVVIGVILGSFLASYIQSDNLKKIFSVLMFFLAASMVFKKKEKNIKKDSKKDSKYIIYPFCLALGLISSIIGIGGSVLSIPMMTHMGYSVKKSIGTGSALTVVVSIPGIISYMIAGYPHMAELPDFSIGYINLIIVGQIIPTSILTASWGVKASHCLPKLLLKRIFALLLIIVSIRMFMSI